MICKKCQCEWNISSRFSQLDKCPFCGVSLVDTKAIKIEDELESVVRNIVIQFGPEILLNKNKFLSIFLDYAPKLKRERKIISFALDEGIAECFVNCSINDRKVNMNRAKNKMSLLMSENAINMVIQCFTSALDWQLEEAVFSSIPSNSNVIETTNASYGSIEGVIYLNNKAYYNCLRPVKVAGKYGYADENNQVVISPKYDRAKPFSFDRAKVFAKGKYGFIDRAGDEVIPLVYDKADDFKGNTTEVVLNGEVFIIDIYGRIIR